MTTPRRRLDAELVRRRLIEDREDAARAIAAGRVLVDGAPALNPARLVGAGEAVQVRPEPSRFVGRGGEKLQGALDRFGLDVTGRRALDVGASTGGFTDCLLQAGADHVVALDVGRNQIHQRLAADPRVTSIERTDVRGLDAALIAPPPAVITVDVSFVSLAAVLSDVARLSAPTADWIVLVKPQFEAPRDVVDAGRGVVRDPDVWRDALARIASALDGVGAAIMGAMVSPLHGAAGNVEFLLHARVPAPADAPALDLDAVVRTAGEG